MAVNATRFGATGADDTALFLKTYTGSFFDPWRETTHFWNAPGNVIEKRTVSFGKQFQYLRMADLPAPDDFTPGDELLGQPFAVDEVNITPDKYLVTHQFVPRDHMKMSHFETLPRLARSHAARLARAYDRRIAILACAAARQTTAVSKNGLTVHKGGNRVTRTGGTDSGGSAVITTPFPASATGAANYRADLRTLRRRMTEDQCPTDPMLWQRPDIGEVLSYDSTGQVWSRDYQDPNKINELSVMKLDGFNVANKMPNTTTNGGPLPDQNLTTESLSKYQYNFLPQAADGCPVAIALATSEDGGAAVGVATFEDVQHHVGYYPEKMSWLVMSFLYVGAGILDPWCAGSIEVIT